MFMRLLAVGMLVLALMVSGCGRGPEDAKKDLSGMKIQYDEASFIAAAERKDKKAVDLFLEAGMSPNVATNQGSPLINAAGNADLEMMELLVDKGANINIKSKGTPEISPIFAVIVGTGTAEEKAAAVKFLLDKDVDLKVRFISDSYSFTPLMMAATQNNVEVLRLIAAKSNANEADVNHGFTALMIAAQTKNVDNVKELLSKGAEVNRKAKNGNTALSCAKSAGSQEVVDILTNAGAK